MRGIIELERGSRWALPANQTLSITVPWLPHHCSAAMCMRRFSEKKTVHIAYAHIQGGPKTKLLEPWCPRSFASSRCYQTWKRISLELLFWVVFLPSLSRIKSNVHAEIWPNGTQFWLGFLGPSSILLVTFLGTLMYT